MERNELLELTKPIMEQLDRMSPYTYLIITSSEAHMVQEEQVALNPKYDPQKTTDEDIVAMQKMGDLTREERHILQHSLGGEKQYRNHFCTNEDTVDYPVCEKLVEKGLMQRRNAADWQGGGYIYNVTDKGRTAAFA